MSVGECVRVTTGAPVPEGSDAVVQVEDTRLSKATDDFAQELEILVLKQPSPGLDIRYVHHAARSKRLWIRSIFVDQ